MRGNEKTRRAETRPGAFEGGENMSHVSSWGVFGNGKKHFRCIQPGRFRGGREKHVSRFQLERFREWKKTLPMYPAGAFSRGRRTTCLTFPAGAFSRGERQTRLRFFLSPWTPLFFHAEASGGWVVSVYVYCATFRRKSSPENGLVLAPGSSAHKYLWASARPLPSGSFASRCALGALRLAWQPN